jgi:PBP1b-binding outer membrane lipoprotein LpoB
MPYLIIILTLALSACSEAEQDAVSQAPTQAIEKAEQVQQQLDDLAIKQRQAIDAQEPEASASE